MKYKYTVIQSDRIGENEYDDDYDNWRYGVDNWGGQCNVGAQSPIDVVMQQILVTSKQLQILTGYKVDPDVFAVKGVNDYYLIGQFGYALFQNNFDSTNNYYCAWRIELKYQSEHYIDGKQYGLEVLVYHKQAN